MCNEQTELQRIWSAEREILDVFHAVCMQHSLRYSLASGTLLGAVRHGGFIPWDDDIDVMMPREDYETLLTVWNTAAPKGYLLQNSYTHPDDTNNFSKIRKDHTTFLESEAERTKTHHKGIFIDVFPADRVAPGKITRALQFAACAINLLYSRGYTSGTGGVVGFGERILLHTDVKHYAPRRIWAERQLRRWNGRTDCRYFLPNTIRAARKYYPSDLFSDMKTIQFCGKFYSCVKDADTALRVEYGDYMQLPPEEERVWKHHPILIDFEHNYEELSGEE